MATAVIGKLERVPLRQVWKHEAYEFSQWLQENIDVKQYWHIRYHEGAANRWLRGVVASLFMRGGAQAIAPSKAMP
jgi:hypothetical protein